MTIGPPVLGVFTAPDVVKVPIEITEHDQVQLAVVIQINPRGAARPTTPFHARLVGDIREGFIPVVVIKLVSTVCGYIEVLETVVIIVTHRNAHPVSLAPQS